MAEKLPKNKFHAQIFQKKWLIVHNIFLKVEEKENFPKSLQKASISMLAKPNIA